MNLDEVPQWQKDRFWALIAVGEPDVCWPWIGELGAREPGGYVRIHFGSYRTYVHRIAFLLSGGVLQEGHIVRHRCDNPPCCNPACLLAGTPADNVRDRDERNRRTPFLPRGAAHWSAKLSDADASRVRLGKACGVRADQLAAMYGVSRSTIYNVWQGVHYAGQSDVAS